MALNTELAARIDELLERGQCLLGQRRNQGQYGPEYWVDTRLVPEVQAWIASVVNLVAYTTLPNSYFSAECARITSSSELAKGAPWSAIQKLQGLLQALREEAARGLLEKIEYVILATAFDDFLDHAEEFHRGNKAREAGVLAAVVLEDTVKRIALKNGIVSNGLSLEQLVDVLVKANVFTPVKAKRIKGHAGVRNPALHAEWDKFDIRDAGELISGTRELIETYL